MREVSQKERTKNTILPHLLGMNTRLQPKTAIPVVLPPSIHYLIPIDAHKGA
jgi:hypothetical protein